VRCPTLYSRWRLTEASLADFYELYYRDLYTGASPDQVWFDMQAESGKKIFENLRSAQVIPSRLDGFRVMEVGSAAGGGLVPFRDAGASVIGIDLDEPYLNFGRSNGIDLRLGGMKEIREFGPQDIVILKDVLEHLPTPVASLEDVRSTLSDRGIVYIQVPGLQALKFLGYRNDLLRYFQIAHLCHYTRESLDYTCKRAGLRVLHSELRGVAICSRAPLASDAVTIEVPSPDHAVDALEYAYRYRRISAIDHWLRSRIPPKAKQFGKRFIR
jgi:2-polyprenyl-3-methyl-5-hydroxy-6-metoxy-1,4-benzoquinol methylase